jgi:Tfp pilus assembly protein FimT
MKRTTDARRISHGFTLIELCAGLGVCAALLSQAVPAMNQMQQEQKLRARAETLAGDLRFARSEAARTSDSVFFRVSGKGANACYVLHTGARNDCDCAGGQAVCKTPGSAVIKAEWFQAGQPVRIASNAETLEFQHRQGLTTQTGSIDVALANGTAIRQVIAITGRVRSCVLGGKLAGLTTCK